MAIKKKRYNLDQIKNYYQDLPDLSSYKSALTLHLDALREFNPNEDYIGMFDITNQEAEKKFLDMREVRHFIYDSLKLKILIWDLIFIDLPLKHPTKPHKVIFVDAVLHHPKEDIVRFLMVKTGQFAKWDHYQQLKRLEDFISLIWPKLHYELKIVYIKTGITRFIAVKQGKDVHFKSFLSPKYLLDILPNKSAVFDLNAQKLVEVKNESR